MFHTAVDVVVGLAALVAILDYFGLKPSTWGPAMSLSRKWKLSIMLGLVAASLGMSGYGLYRSLREEPYQFRWQGDKPQSKQVVGKIFTNEKVVLDDIAYIDCEFINVTFIYNATAPFSLKDSTINGFHLESDNPSVNATLLLLHGLNALRIPGVMKDTGKPPTNIEPIGPRP